MSEQGEQGSEKEGEVVVTPIKTEGEGTKTTPFLYITRPEYLEGMECGVCRVELDDLPNDEVPHSYVAAARLIHGDAEVFYCMGCWSEITSMVVEGWQWLRKQGYTHKDDLKKPPAELRMRRWGFAKNSDTWRLLKEEEGDGWIDDQGDDEPLIVREAL